MFIKNLDIRYSNLNMYLSKYYLSEIGIDKIKAIFAFNFICEDKNYCSCYRIYGLPKGKKKYAVGTLDLNEHGHEERKIRWSNSRELLNELKESEKENSESLKLIYGTTNETS